MPPSRMSYLDGLRGVMALNVALSHFMTAFDFAIYTGRPEHAHGSWEVALSAYPFVFIAAGGNYAVCVFLALSGFVLAKSFHKSDVSAIALVVKRTLRLGLPVLAASLFGWIILSSGFAFNRDAAVFTHSTWLSSQFAQQPSLPDALLQAWNSLLGIPTRENSYNSVLWTMPIEYIGSLLLIRVFATRLPASRPRWAAFIMLALGTMLGRAYISVILFGAALYLLDAPRFTARLRWRPAILVLVLLLGTVPLSIERWPIWDALLSITALVPFIPITAPGLTVQADASIWHSISAVMLVALVTGWPAAQGLLAKPAVRRLGDMSFPLYLAHIPVLFSVGCFVFLAAHAAGLSYGTSVLIAFIAYLPSVLLAAMAFERAVDEPSIQLAAGAAKALAQPAARPVLPTGHGF
ncbi:acyltransferase [Bradyrhizobium sp. ISRA443]|uniref:acyltransferase family protein n=1 Tax=unclassified Bradyrhizobium TaxID=2631580 RepID=UPI00247B2B85|nr:MULTISPECIES: acyltransferase [unclassified Bradyrhizobium]WGR96452.1 acyltransferase [Bradyrhizobium sp. ISRA436]WGS03339.1 acyltransferase [Bradyrhizobium sp. ISRA437]WGS10223.1 acyltransferase [Bradyrhizobium sp. ISRA443]